MKPPICELCGKDFRRAKEGGLVRFADCERLPEGMVGHPKGLAWFCGRHYDAAQALHKQSYGEAQRTLRRKFGFGLWLQRVNWWIRSR